MSPIGTDQRLGRDARRACTAGRRGGCRGNGVGAGAQDLGRAGQPVPRSTSTSWWSAPVRRASSRARRHRAVGGSSWGDRRGCAAGRRRNIGRTWPPRPPLPPCTPWHPLRGRDHRGPRDRLASGRAVVPPKIVRFAYVGPVRSAQGHGARRRSGRGGRPRPPGAPGAACRVPRPTWSRPSCRSPGGRSTAGRWCTTSGRRCRWRRRSWSWPPCGTTPSGTPPWTAGASSTGRWSRSTPGRPAPSGWPTSRTGGSPGAWPTCATARRTTATPARSRG